MKLNLDQYSKNELDQLMRKQTQSFVDFSDALAKGNISELAPPFESYQTHDGDIISYCQLFFSQYNEHLDALDDEGLNNANMMMSIFIERVSGNKVIFDIKKDVHSVEEMILETLGQCFKGLPSEAVAVFEKRMINNDRHLFNLIPQLSVKSALFRVRKDNEHELKKGRELFHVPFDQRIHCGSYRYSILGYPSLYLAHRLSISKLETDIQDNDTYYSACFKPRRELRFIDLALTKSFDAIWERYSLIVFYPLIMACGLKVRSPKASYKPEYALPQVMAQVFRLHDYRDTFDGFSYVSTKVTNPDYMDINMRNYVLWIKGADKEKGYSESLADIFTVSGPIKCRGNQPTEKIENELLTSTFSPVLG